MTASHGYGQSRMVQAVAELMQPPIADAAISR